MIPHYAHYEHLLAQIQLVLFMLGMGVTLSVADFLKVLRQPRSLVVAGTGQVIVLPLLAYFFGKAARLPDGIALGLILIAALPGGNLSKFFTFVGRGNVALSISLSIATTLAALATIPLQLRFLAAEYIPADFVMPMGSIIRELILFLLLPLAVGMVLGRCFPYHQTQISRWFIRFGFIVVLVMIVGSLGRIDTWEYGWKVPVVIIVFCLLSQQLNMLPFYIFPWPREDRLAAGIEVTMRNINLAMLLKPILFPMEDEALKPLGDAVLFVILYYAGVALGAGVPLALNHRRLWRKQLQRESSLENA